MPRKIEGLIKNRQAAVLSLESLRPDPQQPRADLGDLDALVDAYRHARQVPPILVRYDGSGNTIVDGERRWTAACMARDSYGVDNGITVEFEAKNTSRADRKLMQLARNEGKPLSDYEKAQAYHELKERDGVDVKTIATKAGISRGTVDRLLRIYNAIEAVGGPPAAKLRTDWRKGTLNTSSVAAVLKEAGISGSAASPELTGKDGTAVKGSPSQARQALATARSKAQPSDAVGSEIDESLFQTQAAMVDVGEWRAKRKAEALESARLKKTSEYVRKDGSRARRAEAGHAQKKRVRQYDTLVDTAKRLLTDKSYLGNIGDVYKGLIAASILWAANEGREAVSVGMHAAGVPADVFAIMSSQVCAYTGQHERAQMDIADCIAPAKKKAPQSSKTVSKMRFDGSEVQA